MTTVIETFEASRQPVRAEQTPRARILVVDDERVNCVMLAALLRKYHYEATTAASGREALALVIREPFDLVLLDVVMPDQHGFEVLRDLRELASAAELPVIMCTSATDSRQVVEAFEHGANDYITKPFDVDVTLARIAMHLNLKRVQTALRESEERYALAARGTNDGLWDWNLKTGEVYYSPRWYDIMGYSLPAMDDSPQAWLDCVHPDDRERVRAELQATATDRSETSHTEFRVVDRDGSHRWVLCRWLAVRDVRGNLTRIAGSVADITNGKVSGVAISTGAIYVDWVT